MARRGGRSLIGRQSLGGLGVDESQPVGYPGQIGGASPRTRGGNVAGRQQVNVAVEQL